MEILAIAVAIALVAILVKQTLQSKKSTTPPTEDEPEKTAPTYVYAKKSCIMTKSELDFFAKANTILGEKYYIVPQAHLSSFLEHKTVGQSWNGAFKKINGKSVDFLICDKVTSEPKIAIELDDFTHDRADRMERDEFVEAILKNASIPLVRFKANEWATSSQILEKISNQLANKSFDT